MSPYPENGGVFLPKQQPSQTFSHPPNGHPEANPPTTTSSSTSQPPQTDSRDCTLSRQVARRRPGKSLDTAAPIHGMTSSKHLPTMRLRATGAFRLYPGGNR